MKKFFRKTVRHFCSVSGIILIVILHGIAQYVQISVCMCKLCVCKHVQIAQCFAPHSLAQPVSGFWREPPGNPIVSCDGRCYQLERRQNYMNGEKESLMG